MKAFFRLLVTVGIPVVVLWAKRNVILPGVDPEFARSMGSTSLSVFALGVMPIVSAYLTVEIVAFLVPRWARLRHDPAGRVKLERAVRWLTLALAVSQSYGAATMLQGIELDGTMADQVTTSKPVVMASLVAGVCVLYALAEIVSRQGLINGLVALLTPDAVLTLGRSLALAFGVPITPYGDEGPRLTGLDTRTVAIGVLALVTVLAASWAVVSRTPRPATIRLSDGSEPYRSVERRLAEPWLPIPVSTLQAYGSAVSLLMLPTVLLPFRVPLEGLVRGIDAARTPVTLVLTVLVGLVFTRLLHRPKELADFKRGLDPSAKKALTARWEAELRRAAVPSFLFLALVVTAQAVSVFELVQAIWVATVVVDLVRSFRAELGTTQWVSVRAERRATAVPILREALAEEGIACHVRGFALLSLYQAFLPYAPAEIRVPSSDAARASEIVGRALAGAPSAGDESDERPPNATQPLSYGRFSGALAAAAVAMVAVRFVPPAKVTASSEPRAELELVRVDDTIDPFRVARAARG